MAMMELISDSCCSKTFEESKKCSPFMIKKEVNDLEKKYAFMQLEEKMFIELLKEQKIENIHVAEFRAGERRRYF